MKKKVISIIIRVRNAEKDLQRCLGILREQQLPEDHELEIIVVNNESTDNSDWVARKYGAKVVFLPVKDFSWGRALNRGIYVAVGEIVVLLSADAYPVDRNWIVKMVAPFENVEVGAVYGRQIPRPDASIDEIVRLEMDFLAESRSFYLCNEAGPSGTGMIVSNACAAIRKSLWEKLNYDEDIEGGEEGVWTYEILRQGYCSYYNADAKVYHSHNDSLTKHVLRTLELISKNSKLNRKNFYISISRYPLSRFKKLVLNVILVKGHGCAKLVSILKYPFECILILMFASIWKTRMKSTIRERLWK